MNSIMFFLLLSQIYLANSQNVEQSDYPYVVHLHYNDTQLPHCTGTLIEDDWVLTAAHCLDPTIVGKKHPLVFAGSGVHQRKTKKVELHPHFERESLKFDIGLIQVTHPFNTSSPNVSTVHVADSAWPKGHALNRSCVLVGYTADIMFYYNATAEHGDGACNCHGKMPSQTAPGVDPQGSTEATTDVDSDATTEATTDDTTEETTEATTKKPAKKPLEYEKKYVTCVRFLSSPDADYKCTKGDNGEALICNQRLVGVGYGVFENGTCSQLLAARTPCPDREFHFGYVPAHVKWIKDCIGHHWIGGGGGGASTLTLAPIFLVAIAGQILNIVKNL